MTVPDDFPLGTYTVRGVIQDLAGNPTTVTLILHVTGDRTAPQTTIDSKPADPWGSSSATFGFSSNEPGSTFECKLDDGAFAPCASPKTYENLAEGSHTFQARATDGAGNTDATPANHTWTVDYAPCGGDPSLVACYLLDEGTGGTAYDGGAAPANNATLTGSPTWVAGVAGGACASTARRSTARPPDEASLDIVNQITIVAWIKPETTSGTPQDLVKKAVNSVTNGYELTLASTELELAQQGVRPHQPGGVGRHVPSQFGHAIPHRRLVDARRDDLRWRGVAALHQWRGRRPGRGDGANLDQ